MKVELVKDNGTQSFSNSIGSYGLAYYESTLSEAKSGKLSIDLMKRDIAEFKRFLASKN